MLPPPHPLPEIAARLDGGVAATELIEELNPRNHDEALNWARRLPLWEEFRDDYPDRVIAVARLVSRRAMHEHGLALTEDGRVIERPREAHRWRTPDPTLTFALRIADSEVQVEYTRGYFLTGCQDHFQFRSPHEPAQSTPLSPTGWHSHFADHDAVEACGGPEAYATLYSRATIKGQENEFVAAFMGKRPERPLRRRTVTPATTQPGDTMTGARTAVGPHSTKITAEEAQSTTSPDDNRADQQPTLF